MNNGPDDPDWYPALRGEEGQEEEKKREETEEVARARQVLQEMQAREISPEDYETLKEVEEILRRAEAQPAGRPALPLAGYLTQAYESYIEDNELGVESHRISLMLQRGMKSIECTECETQLTGSQETQFKCVKLKCGHFLHRVGMTHS